MNLNPAMETAAVAHLSRRVDAPRYAQHILRIGLALLLVLPFLPAYAALSNHLAGHPSAYLAQHGEDPVAWQEWNAQTLALARKENKPLFVSLGYFACHWCHVMQQESYRDPGLAALINQHFIPVKVDRELNPGLDAALMDFSRRLNGNAGWPLNVFITPEGYPFFATLYQPPARFKSLLERLARHWQTDSAGIRSNARDARQPRQAAAHPLAAEAGDLPRITQRFLEAVRADADPLQGGFGQQSRFPHVPRLLALLDLYAQGQAADLGDFLRLTLEAIARHLRDPVNGGFFRYATDPDWSTPHFEKMLYDNAQLALLYSRAGQVLQEPAYRNLAHATLDFLLERLAAPDGGFYTSLSALDRQGREGGGYLWRPEELKSLLTPDQYRQVRRAWKLDQASPFATGYFPRAGLLPQEMEPSVMVRLQTASRDREPPRDRKISAGLNGLALSAFSLAGADVQRFQAAARRLRDFTERSLLVQGGPVKALAAGQVVRDAELDDYAYLAQGLLDYATARNDPAARRLAERLVSQAWERFFAAGGWRREVRSLLAIPTALESIPDTAVPSASAVLMLASLRLPGSASPPALERALAYAARRGRIEPLQHASVIAVLREKYRLGAEK